MVLTKLSSIFVFMILFYAQYSHSSHDVYNKRISNVLPNSQTASEGRGLIKHTGRVVGSLTALTNYKTKTFLIYYYNLINFTLLLEC